MTFVTPKDPWGLQEIIANQTQEIERLREEFSKAGQTIIKIGQQNEELRTENKGLNEIIEACHERIAELESKVQERGERMKQLFVWYGGMGQLPDDMAKWFNEDGEAK